jgi:hypothetical protein
MKDFFMHAKFAVWAIGKHVLFCLNQTNKRKNFMVFGLYKKHEKKVLVNWIVLFFILAMAKNFSLLKRIFQERKNKENISSVKLFYELLCCFLCSLKMKNHTCQWNSVFYCFNAIDYDWKKKQIQTKTKKQICRKSVAS